MTADLEQIVLADEECRTRVAFAQKQIERETANARAERERLLDERQKAAVASLENEIAAIREEGEKRLAERRAALEQYLARLAATGEAQLEAAARTYARILSSAAEEADQ